jgi:hypothetical protein
MEVPGRQNKGGSRENPAAALVWSGLALTGQLRLCPW